MICHHNEFFKKFVFYDKLQDICTQYAIKAVFLQTQKKDVAGSELF